MRWWLALAFAGVAALTAIAVVALLNRHSEHAFRLNGMELAIGDSVVAAQSLRADTTRAAIERHAVSIAADRHLAIFVFDSRGRLISSPRSFGLDWSQIPQGPEARSTALSGLRYVKGRRDGSAFTVGLAIHRGAAAALVGYSLRPELRHRLGVIHAEYIQSALIAFGVAAALGLLIATLTARRLARIARAASEIGAGNFGVELKPSSFPDEVGSLGFSIEQMRSQLRELFLALENDRARLERLLDRLNEGVLLIDRGLEVEYANDRARELLDLGRDPGDVVTALPPSAMAIRSLAADLFKLELPEQLRIVAGDRTLLVTGIPPGRGGDNAIVVMFDEAQQENIERVQREFATNAAHELRTPLAAIVTAVEMLQTGAMDDPWARDEFIEVIAREADRLTRLTRALLVLARSELRDESPRLLRVEVRPLLEQVAASQPSRNGVGVSVECAPTLALATDSDLLEQALSNVVANAIQNTERGSVNLRGHRENGTVVIEVEDTGAGIPDAGKERIFDRFYRGGSAADGFGLGLSIAHKSVVALGGEITLDSTPALGTTVRILLPVGTQPL
jgi:signal transduction histidine kinase